MEEIRISYQEAVFYVILGNVLIGVLFGSFPLVAGIKLGNRRYGLFGFIGSVIGGAIVGVIFAYPIAAIFTWLILRSAAPATAAPSDESTGTDEKTIV